jgi:hypothetical protein
LLFVSLGNVGKTTFMNVLQPIRSTAMVGGSAHSAAG